MSDGTSGSADDDPQFDEVLERVTQSQISLEVMASRNGATAEATEVTPDVLIARIDSWDRKREENVEVLRLTILANSADIQKLRFNTKRMSK